MARIDQTRLLSATFPFEVEVATRFTDVDVLWHLNNVATMGILQEGRSRFGHANDFLTLMKGYGQVVASMTVDFAAEMRHPAPVHMNVGILEVGRSSYRIVQIARQNGRIGAFADIVQVATRDRAPAPIPDLWRAKLESLKVTFPD